MWTNKVFKILPRVKGTIPCRSIGVIVALIKRRDFPEAVGHLDFAMLSEAAALFYFFFIANIQPNKDSRLGDRVY